MDLYPIEEITFNLGPFLARLAGVFLSRTQDFVPSSSLKRLPIALAVLWCNMC